MLFALMCYLIVILVLFYDTVNLIFILPYIRYIVCLSSKR